MLYLSYKPPTGLLRLCVVELELFFCRSSYIDPEPVPDFFLFFIKRNSLIIAYNQTVHPNALFYLIVPADRVYWPCLCSLCLRGQMSTWHRLRWTLCLFLLTNFVDCMLDANQAETDRFGLGRV